MSDALTHNERLSYEERILALEMDIERLAKGERPIYADAAKLEARAREVLQADAHGRGWHVAARHDEDAIVNIGTAVSAMMTLARESATPKPPTGGDAGAVERSEAHTDAWNDFVGEYLTDGKGYAAADVWERCEAAFDAGWSVGPEAALHRAIAALALPAPVVEGERVPMRYAADMLDQYAEFIRQEVKADDLERHPYVPLIEDVAAQLRAALSEGRSHG